MLGVAVKPTIKEVDSEGRVTKTLVRAGLWEVQTPQVTPSSALHMSVERPSTKVQILLKYKWHQPAMRYVLHVALSVCQHAQTQSQILTRASNPLRLGCSRLGV